MTLMAVQSIKVAVDLSRGLLVQAKGPPAKIVAYGASAAVVLVSVAVGYGAIEAGRAVYRGVKGRLDARKLPGK